MIAVIIAISVSWAADLAGHGVAVVGAVPGGLPHFGLPALGWHDAGALLGAAASMFVVILAQSAATSRAYAVKYEEAFSQDTDLVGLGAANVAAAFSGTFVVNGSPTKTQMVDSAGGRSQLAQLTTAAVVLSSCSCSPGRWPICRTRRWRRWSSSSRSSSSTSAGCGASWPAGATSSPLRCSRPPRWWS